MSGLSAFQQRILLIAAVLALNLPFLGQAVHIDDRIYLETAANILEEPLFPYDYPVTFEGIVTPDAASHSHLPLPSYWLALIHWTIGSDQEWVYHLSYLVFPLILALSAFEMAVSLTRNALATALLVVVSPAVYVLSHTLMADVPLLAFWMAALALFRRLCLGDCRRRNWILCAAALLAAAFTSMLTAGLLLLMGLYWVLSRRAGGDLSSRRLALLLCLPLALWILWYLRAYLHYDRFVLVNTVLHMEKREAFDWSLTATKAAGFVLNTGAVFTCPLVLWLGLGRAMSLRIFALAAMLGMIPFAFGIGDWTWSQAILLSLFATTGGLTVWSLASGAIRALRAGTAGSVRRADDLLLICWFFGIAAFCLLLYYAGSVRYVLLAVPPVILWLVRALEEGPLSRRVHSGRWVWAVLAVTLPFSAWLAAADAQFADMYRQAARETALRHQAPGRTIWFTAEWGLRYYWERAGARLLTRNSVEPRAGDVILKPYVAFPWQTLYDPTEFSVHLGRTRLTTASDLRLLDFGSHAGFYSTGWGILPFSWAAGKDWEWINAYRVLKAYDGPIPEPERHW